MDRDPEKPWELDDKVTLGLGTSLDFDLPCVFNLIWLSVINNNIFLLIISIGSHCFIHGLTESQSFFNIKMI